MIEKTAETINEVTQIIEDALLKVDYNQSACVSTFKTIQDGCIVWKIVIVIY